MENKHHLIRLNNSYLNKKYNLFGFTEEINDDSLISIKLTNVYVSFANALRRIMISEIPTFAFVKDDVKILINKSIYHQDVLAERFGYIVINCHELEKYNPDDFIFSISNIDNFDLPLKNETTSILKIYVHQHLFVQKISTSERIDIRKL